MSDVDDAIEQVVAEVWSVAMGEAHPTPQFARKIEATLTDVAAEVQRLREQVAAGEASDGYHTHNELYEYRLLYNAALFNAWRDLGTVDVVKSWRHSDGEPCFGGGWFIVVAHLATGQISNHYQAEHWDLFRIPEVDLPPEYDGHTPADAASRLRAALKGGEGER